MTGTFDTTADTFQNKRSFKMSTNIKKRKNLFTQSLSHLFTSSKNAFTLAELLITLGVIGVVAAVTMPTLVTNIQERVRQEQVRTVKYKFTKATEKMNSLGLIGHYDSTMDFVNELKKHMSIAKICDSSKLNECWGYQSFTNANASKTYTVSNLKTGKNLEALQLNSGDRDTVGIITGDGVPIILTYGKECQALDESKQYQWSTVNGKPETNATAGCVSMVFDINGPKAPNRIGTDVRTMNSLLGNVYLGTNYKPLTPDECDEVKKRLGIKYCGGFEEDYWAGAMKACDDLGLHLPSMTTLAQIATIYYGVQIEPYEMVAFAPYCSSYSSSWSCKTKVSSTENSLPISVEESYWSSQEYASWGAYIRDFNNLYSIPDASYPSRNTAKRILCLAD